MKNNIANSTSLFLSLMLLIGCILLGIRANAATNSGPSFNAAIHGGNTEITTNQEPGVDEGGLVKNYRDYMIVLRNGALSSVSVSADGELRLNDSITVGPEIVIDGASYDELLISNNRAIVIGYRPGMPGSAFPGLTELVFFSISEEGRFARIGTKIFESGDYYSNKNYAGRMIGSNLVLSLPFFAYEKTGTGNTTRTPRVFTEHATGLIDPDKPLFQNQQVYGPSHAIEQPYLYAFVVCDTSFKNFSELECQTHAVIESAFTRHYVTQSAAYLWAKGQQDTNYLYRLDFDHNTASLTTVSVEPVDQFSFKETNKTFYLFGSAEGSAACPVSDMINALSEFSIDRSGNLNPVGTTCLPGDAANETIVNKITDGHLLYGADGLTFVDLNSKYPPAELGALNM